MADPQNAAASALAQEVGGQLGGQALGVLKSSWSMVSAYIQRGPQGMSWLCFVGGMTTFAFGLLGFIDIFEAVFEPLYYLVNFYQMLFGLATCILEAPVEWVGASAQISQAQKFLLEYAKFLTTFGGRGLFYLFQGSLSISLTGVSLQFLLGCYMFFVGALCIAAQYGIIAEDMGFRAGAHSRQQNDSYIRIES
mmetsp:Transcript_10710/g.28472  ORF Transcript_10710/g.28472 Transcript_10710/m.28472 type:complete len:194 (+) Transcript_10710:94-675(+)